MVPITSVVPGIALLQAVVESSSDIITVLDPEGRLLYSSPAAERVLGNPPGTLQGETVFESVHPDDVAETATAFLRLAAEGPGATATAEFRMRHADGTYRTMESIGTNRVDDPAVGGVVINSRDVSDRVAAEQAAQAEKERYRQLAEASPAVIAVHQGGRLVYVNPAAVRLFGAASEQELLGRPVLDLVHPEDQAVSQARFAALEAGEELPVREQRLVRLNGETVDAEVVAVSCTFDGAPAVLSLAQDVTDRRRAERALAQQALHDHLTGLPNRALLMDRLAQALARRSEAGHRVGVLFLDLDRFKVVNDSLGHDAGDRVLQTAATRILGALRPSDTLARLGGDEFVVVCEDLQGPAEATRVSARIIEALGRPFDEVDEELVVGVSIGISLAAADATPEALLQDADAAMYRAKEHGRGRAELFDAGMRARLHGRLRQERELRRALQHDELRLHYQPVVRLPSLEVSGVEALVRWQHPTKGLVAPAEFIPLAEDTGLILDLGAWVLATACRQGEAWADQLDGRPLELALNVSTRQLAQPDLAKQVGALVARHHLDPSHVALCLEITESLLLEDPLVTSGLLGDLRALGVRLAIDDFGTGYSSLAYLRRFPVDTLKIDQSFVAGLGDDADSRAVASAIVELAHALGLEVVAEGVEEQEQLDVLIDLGCDRAQGFLFSRPQPAEDLLPLLRR